MPFGNSTQQMLSSNPAFQETQKSFSAFTGADIVAYMGHKRVATLQGITVSITREIAPVFTMGEPNPRAFAKGKRAIAGNLVFTQFDKHAILKAASLIGIGSASYAAADYIGDLANFQVPSNQQLGNSGQQFTGFAGVGNTISNGSVAGGAPIPINNDPRIFAAISQELAETYALIATRKLRYADQVPPFDITITMVNELGQSAYTAIHNVQLVNEGWGYTLDDLNSEVAFTFVARAVTPLDSLLNMDGTYFNDGGSTIVG